MKQRYAGLDALRGVASLFVVAFHFGMNYPVNWPQFSFLAVDLFFGLSGFVLAAGYDNERGRLLGPKKFMIRRAVRLYPLYLVGVGLAALHPAIYKWADGHLALPAFASAILMLPSPTWNDFPALFPALLPGWSLFFELFVANFTFSLIMGRTSAAQLASIVFLSGGVLLAFAYHHYLQFPEYPSFNMGVVWSKVLGGVPRTIFSFFAGVLLFRIHGRKPALRLPAWIVLFAFTALMLPRLSGVPMQIFQACCIFALFPLIIYFGAGSIERSPWLGNILGETSFALYAIHNPLINIWVSVGRRLYPGLDPQVQFLIFISLVLPAALMLAAADKRFQTWWLLKHASRK